MSIGHCLNEGTQLLKSVGIEAPALDARILMEHALSCTAIELIVAKERLLLRKELELFYALLARRLCFEPIAYILGSKEFYGYDFLVGPECLIPRPDTETVVEHCLALLKDKPHALVYDVGTGSGAIVLTILKERPDISAIATDYSLAALKIAEENARRLLIRDRIDFYHGDLFEPVKLCAKADLIVSNPPYIGADDIKDLAPDVRNYEPKEALTPGDSLGLSLLERLISEASHFLHDGGFLVLEIGFNQGNMVMEMAKNHFGIHGIFRDLAGNERVVVLNKKPL